MSPPFVIALLKTPGTAFGITAPLFIWGAAFLILSGTLACLVWLWWLVRRDVLLYRRVISQFASLQATHGEVQRDGMVAAMYAAIAQVFDDLAAEIPTLVAAWRRFDAQVVVQRDPMGHQHFWTPESTAETFNDATLIEPRLNRQFFSAIPGIATSAGLLCTFLAILIALLDVTLRDEQFQGLDTLISGLSGKFLSSIAALSVATLYVIFEKRLQHRLSQSVHELAVILDVILPRLTPTRLLLTMQEQAQATGPALEHMTHTVTALQAWLQTAETQRVAATTGPLEGLLQQLERTLSTTLAGLGDRFAHTLSHAANQEFESVASALGNSAQLLADMNTQFLGTQTALNHLVELSKTQTVEQMAVGKAQVEDLTAVLREMMTQMHDTAGLSVNRMAATLTTVVHDLSAQVSEMGERMSQTVTANTGQATEAAQAMMGQVDQWSTHSTQQLAQLIDKHQAHLERVQDVQRTLDLTLAQFKSTVSEYATVTTGLKSVAAQTTTLLTAATGAVNRLQETGVSIERVATLAAGLGERLTASNHQQDDMHQRLAVNLQRYQQVFHEVEHAASTLLDQVEQHLRHYMATTQQGFTHLTEAADTHFANASQRLGDMVNGLDEHLQDLTDILERLGRFGGTYGRQ